MGNPHASIDEVYEVAKLIGIHDFIVSLPQGYESFIGEQGMNLSGGQKQAIAIARALLKKASILILDEATSGIDEDSEKRIFANLKMVMQNQTMIVVAHNTSMLDCIDKRIYLE